MLHWNFFLPSKNWREYDLSSHMILKKMEGIASELWEQKKKSVFDVVWLMAQQIKSNRDYDSNHRVHYDQHCHQQKAGEALRREPTWNNDKIDNSFMDHMHYIICKFHMGLYVVENRTIQKISQPHEWGTSILPNQNWQMETNLIHIYQERILSILTKICTGSKDNGNSWQFLPLVTSCTVLFLFSNIYRTT